MVFAVVALLGVLWKDEFAEAITPVGGLGPVGYKSLYSAS